MSITESVKQTEVCIIGGGPAGLTAAYQLRKSGVPCIVLEADPVYVGGISRSHRYNGYLLDIGGHRFFSKWKEAEELWSEILPDDMLTCNRQSRILYRGALFNYPLSPLDALRKLGMFEALHCLLSYMKARLTVYRTKPNNFETWVVRAFGRRLYEIFFKTYTEKVWGMKCCDISQDWAAQRIKPISVTSILISMVRQRTKPSNISTFRYPPRGPGMMWEKMADEIRLRNGKIMMGCKACNYTLRKGKWHTTYTSSDGKNGEIIATHIICSAPLGTTIPLIRPTLQCISQANGLAYRDYLICALIFREDAKPRITDHWLYVHDPNVGFARVQNYAAWSPALIATKGTNCWGLEYFCFADDGRGGVWNMPDAQIVAMAKREIVASGLLREEQILDGCVVRQPKAYPIYDRDYQTHVAIIKNELQNNAPCFYPIGRNGLHMYNNQDHSMMTALLTVTKIVDGTQVDPWHLPHQDTEYHETGTSGSVSLTASASGERFVPQAVE